MVDWLVFPRLQIVVAFQAGKAMLAIDFVRKSLSRQKTMLTLPIIQDNGVDLVAVDELFDHDRHFVGLNHLVYVFLRRFQGFLYSIIMNANASTALIELDDQR